MRSGRLCACTRIVTWQIKIWRLREILICLLELNPGKMVPGKLVPGKLRNEKSWGERRVSWCVWVWNVQMWSIYENPKLDNKHKTRKQTQNSETKNRGVSVEHRGVCVECSDVINLWKPKIRQQIFLDSFSVLQFGTYVGSWRKRQCINFLFQNFWFLICFGKNTYCRKKFTRSILCSFGSSTATYFFFPIFRILIFR